MADKGRFPHYMIKEIFDQPQGLRDTIQPRVSLEQGIVKLDEVRISPEELRDLRRISIVASGTSRHAGMAGQYMIQELTNIPVDVDYASEFEYRNPLIGRGELTIVITQSGETADTTAAQREARAKGSRTIAISNVVDSTIAREADGVIYTNAGPEISIASTKAFTAQMAVLFLFALYLGQVREKLSKEQVRRYIRELLDLPGKVDTVLRYEKNLANIKGFKEQSGRVIAIATQGDEAIRRLADQTIFIPEAPELLSPILEIVPLQLFAYYMTVQKGLDVDRPRNLVKSVMLE